MAGLKILLDSINYPDVESLVSGQKVNLNIAGTVQKVREGAMVSIEVLSIGKKSKMNTQQILLSQMNDRLANIEAKQPGVAARP